MLQAGEKRELTVVKETNFGVYLAEEEHSKDKVLLPKKEAETIKCGDKVSVFLYLDSSDRLIATRREPVLTKDRRISGLGFGKGSAASVP